MCLLKVLNPVIWLWNLFKFQAHTESQRNHDYKSYDFTSDTRYY